MYLAGVSVRRVEDITEALWGTRVSPDDVKNLSQIWAVAPALAKLALRDDRRGHLNKEPPWKKITEGPPSAT
jgi:hypothetical protein